MSISVRAWADEDLAKVRTDKWLATLLMNAGTLTKAMARAYPYSKRRTYHCQWGDTEPEVIVYATDERMLAKFLDSDYLRRPDSIYQRIT